MFQLMLLRHGQSQWNLENRFTGWTDVDLTEQGVNEAKNAGKIMKEQGFDFDYCHTSVLQRAIKTTFYALEAMDRLWLPVEKHWRLNERHYGDLQGFNKSEMAEKVGEEQVKLWRRSYDVPPPALQKNDPRHPSHDLRYRSVVDQLPDSECLKDTVDRVLPYWNQVLAPQILDGKKLLIVAHGNSLRALVKYLDQMTDQAIIDLNIPTGIPLLYELDAQLQPISHRYLGDQEAIAKAAEAVANQGRKER